MNLVEVQEALHVSRPYRSQGWEKGGGGRKEEVGGGRKEVEGGGKGGAGKETQSESIKWDFCSDVVFEQWAFNDYLGDTTHLYSEVYNHKHKPKGTETIKLYIFKSYIFKL